MKAKAAGAPEPNGVTIYARPGDKIRYGDIEFFLVKSGTGHVELRAKHDAARLRYRHRSRLHSLTISGD